MAEHSESGINVALLDALPPAERVLELGCSDGRLGRSYKQRHPAARWVGVDISEPALREAALHLDAVHRLDAETDDLARAGSGFDLIVLGDVLEHLRRPDAVLAALTACCTLDARLVCCIPNMGHCSVIERLVRGDLMYDPFGLLDTTHLRFLTPRAAFKALLDAGWLPDAAGGYGGGHANPAFAEALLGAAAALGLSRSAAELDLETYQLVIRCRRRPPSVAPARGATVSVIVVSDDAATFDLNLRRSPGLSEIGAETIVVRGAASAGEAVAAGLGRAAGDWLLICTDDVYVPRGSGFALVNELAAIQSSDAAATLIGFAGVGVDVRDEPFAAGQFVERRSLHDGPAAERAVALADWAVVMHRTNPLRPDAGLGRHLWATDLCLRSMAGPAARCARIVRIPLFHNTAAALEPDAAFLASARRLGAKYPHLASIVTPAGTLRPQSDARPAAPAS